jgi:hypothetical protein
MASLRLPRRAARARDTNAVAAYKRYLDSRVARGDLPDENMCSIERQVVTTFGPYDATD